MKRFDLLVIALMSSASAFAITPLWLRDTKISPDGKYIAFTYMGDIYKVPSEGGNAIRLTSQPGYESDPVWSPDSKQIAFADNRNGNTDVYVMSADGGMATRLTTNSVAETPESFSPDGKYVYFSASIQDPASSALFPSRHLTELYKVPVSGGKAVQTLATPAELISFLPDGKSFLYQDVKGSENNWRKHHTSSVTRDIWKYDAGKGTHINLTAREGEDRNPLLSPHGKTVYFLSERDGKSFNVYSFPLDNPSSVKQITSFKQHPVRFLSGSDSGKLAFTYDGEIYTMTPGSSPTKVPLDLVIDNSDDREVVNIASNHSEATVSPDGKQVAIVNRGNIFVTSVEYNTTRQITDTPAAEMHVTWHPKSRELVYTSERDGHWNIYSAKIGRDDDPDFPNATIIEEKPLFKASDGKERTFPQYSPDGNKLAYIENRESLMVKDLKSGNVKRLTDGSMWTDRSGGFSYTWSPDSRYIALEVVDRKHDPYTDIAIVGVEDGTITNLTSTGYFDEAPQWVLEGNAVMFKSNRLGMRNHASWGSLQDIFLIFVNQDAYDRFRLSEEDYALLKEVEKQQKKSKDKSAKAKDKDGEENNDEKADKNIKVELDGISDRIVRLTPNSSDLSGIAITGDGETLYYMSAFDKGYDLWKKNLRKGEVSLVKKLGAASTAIESDASGKTLFLLSSKAMKKLDPKGDKLTAITASGRQILSPAAEREAMFNNVVFQEREMFYDPKMHGVDWEKLTTHYRKFLPHINNGYDFAEMLSELLGELNVSHTGSGYTPASTTPDATASLGLLYDMKYTGKGLKVDEVVAGSPFDRASSKLEKNCIIERVNNQPIDENTDYNELLNGLIKKKTLVSIYNPTSGERWDEVILPISNGDFNELLYKRWVKGREAEVDRLSGGRLGYVHIRAMNDNSFRPLYADVLGKFNDREGIVIDTRWNGGGRMHEDIEIFFSGDKYLTQVVRGKETCDMPSRRWNKPSIMLICEANYSNAHGTPWVYSHEKIGKLVGMPVPGTMTSVNWKKLQNTDYYFGIPVVGYRTAEGNYLENTELQPDIRVANDPASVVAGVDLQLKTAVDELLRQIDNK